MEENLIKKPAYSEKTYSSAGGKKTEKSEKEEDRDFYEEKPVSINFQENKESLKPLAFNVPGLSKIAEEKSEKNETEDEIKIENKSEKVEGISGNEVEEQSFDEQKAEEWVDKFLPFEVLDAYGLSYEGSKKSNEKKRKNQRYRDKFKKAKTEYKEYLKERLSSLLLSGNLYVDSSDEEVFDKIIEIFESGRHAKNLIKAMRSYWDGVNKSSKDSTATFNKNTKNETSEEEVSSRESVKDEEEVLASAQAGIPDDPDDKKPDSNKKEAPKTKSEFFGNYPDKSVYVNRKDGSDLSVLDYDVENQEVLVYQYQSFVYNEETESWGSAKERGREKKIKYDDFLDLMEDYVLDQDSDQEQENKLENGNLKGFYINEKGEFFKLKNYFKRKNDEGKLENFVKIEVSKKTREDGEVVMKTEDYYDFIKKGRFDFYNNGKEMEEAFNKKIERIKKEIQSFEILSFSYNSGEDKYLIKIKELKQPARFVSFKELQKLAEEEKENVKNSNEKRELNEIEKKIFEIFEKELKEYKRGVYEKTQENFLFKEDTRDLIVRDYVKNYLEERLPKRIKKKVEQYKISNVDQERILEEFKKI